MSEIQTEARNADVRDIITVLQDMRARRHDVIVTADQFRSVDGNLVVNDSVASIDETGVTTAAGTYRPLVPCDEKMATKLDIGTGYLRGARQASRFDLYDAAVNGALHGSIAGQVRPDGSSYPQHPAYPKKVMLRLLQGDPGEPGIARAFLSSRFNNYLDNLDLLMAVMGGIRDLGVNAVPLNADLSQSRMYVRFGCPEIAAMAPKLLDGYRSSLDQPGGAQRVGRLGAARGISGWSVPQALAAAAGEGQGYAPGSEPVVFAGLKLSNSDVGDGKWTLAPEILVRVCRNGLTLDVAAKKRAHIGADQPVGEIEWSAETARKELELISSQAKDLTRKFLKPGFLNEQVADIEVRAGVPLPNAESIVKDVTKAAGFTEYDADEIMKHFWQGGQNTAGGVANAMTAYAQTVENPDKANLLEVRALKAMDLAAARA